MKTSLLIFLIVMIPNRIFPQCASPSKEALSGIVDKREDLGDQESLIIIDSYVLSQMNIFDKVFNLRATRFYYDDRPLNSVVITKLIDNTIENDAHLYFGKNLFLALANDNQYGNDAMATVIFHEYAHILQFKISAYLEAMSNDAIMDDIKEKLSDHDLDTSMTVLPPLEGKQKELQADCLAGYFLGRLRGGVKIDKVYKVLQKLGDTDFTNEDKHGIPTERQLAASTGMSSPYQSTKDLILIYFLSYSFITKSN